MRAQSVGVPVTINVLANDTDADNDPLFVTAVASPAHGTAELATLGNVTYTPQQGFIGNDLFSYTISDGHGHFASANVHVTVTANPNQPPIAVDDNASTTVGLPITINVLANDSDPDNDPLTVIAVTTPGAGVASINGNGTVTYTPDPSLVGSDTFGYTISDGHGHTASATVHVTVTQTTNQPPVAVDDMATMPNTIPSIAIDVLANDFDPDGDPLTIVAVSVPAPFGSTQISMNNMIIFDNNGQSGNATFNYTISDGHGHIASAQVSVFVSSP